MEKFVAYYRVSTERQGKSGLGLAAQRRKVEEFLSADHELIGEFCDVQSGRDDSRIELQRAIQLAETDAGSFLAGASAGSWTNSPSWLTNSNIGGLATHK